MAKPDDFINRFAILDEQAFKEVFTRIFELLYVRDYSYKETCQEPGISIQTVRIQGTAAIC